MKNLVAGILSLFLLVTLFSCKQTKEDKTEGPVEDAPVQQEDDSMIVTDSITPALTELDTELDNILSKQYYHVKDGEKADIQVRVGDVDNLGFGWDAGFDPFCGKNTSRHRYPWDIDENDHPGTDRIMVASSYESGRRDGYTSYTKAPANAPVEISITYDKPEVKIEQVVLQMLVDDFQAPVWGTSFQFHINEKRLTYIENIINTLNQTGPIGKLLQVGVLAEDLPLFESGSVNIKIDDPITGAGDGYAIDFIQLLINPKGDYECTARISGLVTDEQNNPLKDVLVSANGLKEGLTFEDGTFTLEGVPVGMISLSASKHSYQTETISFELIRDEDWEVTLVLKKLEQESENYVSEELKAKGFVNLYGILFETGKDIPKKESEPTLLQLANFLKNNPEISIEIIGHTDSDGDFEYNQDLSFRRAQAVKKWLGDRNIVITNIGVAGQGESNPVASNATDSGKALNRRVEIKTKD